MQPSCKPPQKPGSLQLWSKNVHPTVQKYPLQLIVTCWYLEDPFSHTTESAPLCEIQEVLYSHKAPRQGQPWALASVSCLPHYCRFIILAPCFQVNSTSMASPFIYSGTLSQQFMPLCPCSFQNPIHDVSFLKFSLLTNNWSSRARLPSHPWSL